MRKVFFLCVLILACSIKTYGQSNLQSIIQHGVSKAYNMEFDEAEKIFNRAIENYPQQPHGYYRTAQIHFWIYLGTRDPGEYFVFLKYADLAQQKIDKILDADENNYRITYMAGNLASYKAMAYSTNNSSVDQLWASKKAIDYFERTLEINNKFYDAYLGLGIFDYAMGFVPDFLKWAVNLTGLTSDKDRGLKYIKKAFHRGADKTEAAFHLAKIYTDYLADYDSSYLYLNYNVEKHPGNTLFLYQYAVTQIKDRELNRAGDLLNEIIRLNNKHIPQVTSLAHFRKGEILFRKNRFKDAVKEYEKFLKTTKEIDFEGTANYHLALCHKFLGNIEEYEKYMKSAGEGNQDIFEDSYAKNKSEEYLSKGITDQDLMLIRMKNNLEAGKYRIVYDSLKTLSDELITNGQKSLSLIYFAEAAIHLKKFTEANSVCEKLLTHSHSKEKWVVPNAYLLMAMANYAVNEKHEARRLLQEANDNNNFEFKDIIQAQIEFLKRRLNRH